MGKASNKSQRAGRSEAIEKMRAQDAARARREKFMKVGLGAGVAVVALGIIGVAAAVSSNSENTASTSATAEADPSAPLPKGVIPAGQPYEYGVPIGVPASPDAPTLQVWEDFQCPACAKIEELNGAGIKALGTSGRARVILRPTTFLDLNLNTDYSVDATAAWGCAIDQDKTLEYHKAVFDNQPEREGAGWSEEQLISFGESAGITGDALNTFTQCVKDGTYRQWALNSSSVFFANNIAGTPTGIVDDSVTLPGQVLGDPVELEKALFGTAQ